MVMVRPKHGLWYLYVTYRDPVTRKPRQAEIDKLDFCPTPEQIHKGLLETYRKILSFDDSIPGEYLVYRDELAGIVGEPAPEHLDDRKLHCVALYGKDVELWHRLYIDYKPKRAGRKRKVELTHEEIRDQEFKSWAKNVRDPANRKRGGARTIIVRGAKVEFWITQLPRKTWVMTYSLRYNTGGRSHPWEEYPDEQSCLDHLLGESTKCYTEWMKQSSITVKTSCKKMLLKLNMKNLKALCPGEISVDSDVYEDVTPNRIEVADRSTTVRKNGIKKQQALHNSPELVEASKVHDDLRYLLSVDGVGNRTVKELMDHNETYAGIAEATDDYLVMWTSAGQRHRFKAIRAAASAAVEGMNEALACREMPEARFQCAWRTIGLAILGHDIDVMIPTRRNAQGMNQGHYDQYLMDFVQGLVMFVEDCELEDVTGVSLATVKQWLAARSMPDADKIKEIVEKIAMDERDQTACEAMWERHHGRNEQ